MLPECYIFRSNSDPGPFTKDAHSGNYLNILYFYKKPFFYQQIESDMYDIFVKEQTFQQCTYEMLGYL